MFVIGHESRLLRIEMLYRPAKYEKQHFRKEDSGFYTCISGWLCTVKLSDMFAPLLRF